MKYPVVEIFRSVQGEGPAAGLWVTFVRLGGCNLACPFCDTDHTSKMVYLTGLEIARGVAKTWEGLKKGSNPPPTVLTGGEPTIHDLAELGDALAGVGATEVHLETNGTNPIPSFIDLAVVSPKRPFGFLHGRTDIYYKFLVGPDGFLIDPEPFMSRGNRPMAYIQPLWGDAAALAKCFDLMRKEPWRWRLSVQVHKYLEQR